MEGNELDDTLINDVDDSRPVVHLCTGVCKDVEDEESYEVVGMPDSELLCLGGNSNIVTLADGTQWSYITIAQGTEDEGIVQLEGEGGAEERASNGGTEDSCEAAGEEAIDETTGRVILLNDGRLAYLQPKDICQVVPLEDGCATLITVTEPESSETKVIKKRAKSHYCMEPGCARSYTSLHHLKVHIRNHTGDRPYACSVDGCRKAFATDYSRKAHLRTHTGEKPYPCPQDDCPKSFKTSGDLQKHIRTHTGERPFICPVEGCNRSFTTSNIRKVHIRTHTGERPYMCDHPGCERTFASTTNYKNHMRIHSGEKPFICPVASCQKRFTEYSSLYKHQWVHSQEKRHQCPYCHKSYRQTSTLSMHKKTVHGLIAADDGTQLILEQMMGVGHDGSKNFKNITSNVSSNRGGSSGRSAFLPRTSYQGAPVRAGFEYTASPAGVSRLRNTSRYPDIVCSKSYLMGPYHCTRI